ncbi:MAG: phosphoglucosamine mutase [Gaiellaceae bacterium]|nr:phosphoglucosamine mutase [Gaiellaceae bacterium]
MARLFGTDGVRGVANGSLLTAELALGLGRAAARYARERGARAQPRVLIGRDTRRSGFMLEDALAAGVASAGGLAVRVGVLPTPGIATLVRLGHADLGVVISASHNPFPDNGIKLFGGDGFKLDDADEDRVVDLMDADDLPTGSALGESITLQEASTRYADWVIANVGGTLSPRRILVDCANGAASVVASRLFEGLGIDADLCFASPDGLNINEKCGSTHLEVLSRGVAAGGYELGLAFDGDADRVLAVTSQGVPVDGDQIVAILARDLHARHALPGKLVVVTSMSNLGFHRAMRTLGIETAVTEVGDRYVLEEMRARGSELGGEQSGHVIALGHQTTGDGLVTASLLLAALERAGQTLEEAAGLVRHFPQRLVNIRADREGLADSRAIWDVVDRESAVLDASGAGRIVLRASGTESLVRVMVEHEDPEELERLCGSISLLVERELGVA